MGTPVRADCLIRGECAAVPLGQPDDIALAQKGFTKLGDARGHPGAAIQCDRGPPRLGTGPQGCGDAPHPGLRGRLSVHARAPQPRRDGEDRRGIDRRSAGCSAGGARLLLRTRPRRDAQAGGDRHGRHERGDRAPGPYRRAQGAACGRRPLRRPSVSRGRRAQGTPMVGAARVAAPTTQARFCAQIVPKHAPICA